ncbi:MAG: hypothetical protein QXF41_00745 [Candidatus Micrarchaeaceae archaeon]
MDYTQLIIRKREDIGKVFLFFPHTGIALETECKDVNTVHSLLELMKNKSIKEIEEVCHTKKIPDEMFEEVKAIYKDLKSMDIHFDKE